MLTRSIAWALEQMAARLFAPRDTVPVGAETAVRPVGYGAVRPSDGTWWLKLLRGGQMTQIARMQDVSFEGTRMIWVAQDAAAGGNGSLGRPFASIQDAISTIPAATDAASMRRVWMVMIAPGTYDEDLDIDGTGRNIILAALGPCNLGQFDAGGWQPSGPQRSITWHLDAPQIDGILPTLRIYSLNDSLAGVPWESYSGNFRISGDIHCVRTAPFAKFCASMTIGAEVYGNVDHGAGFNGTLWVSFKRATVQTQTNIPAAIIDESEMTIFNGLVTADNVVYARECVFNSGITIANGPPNPGGFCTCVIGGTFTGPAGSAVCDNVTYAIAKANGLVLAGGATLQLIDQGMASQTDYTPNAPDWQGTPPDNVQTAMDRMVAVMVAAHGVIP